MQKRSNPFVGVYTHLPVIAATMGQLHGPFPRNERVFLENPKRDISGDEAFCHGFDLAGNEKAAWVPWEKLRLVEHIRTPVISLAGRCYRMTVEEFEAILQELERTKVPLVDDFGVDLGDMY